MGEGFEEASILATGRTFGALDPNFLCQSLSLIGLKQPVCVNEDTSLAEVVEALQKNKIGCLLIVDKAGKLKGIFSERDCVLKVVGKIPDLSTRNISEFMTKDPVTQPPDGSVAYALNLMSQGGFRHIPIVDQDMVPIGIVSIKDIVDYLVARLTEDLLNFPNCPIS